MEPIVLSGRVKRHHVDETEDKQPIYRVTIAVDTVESSGTLTLKSDIVDIRDMYPLKQDLTIRVSSEQTELLTIRPKTTAKK